MLLHGCQYFKFLSDLVDAVEFFQSEYYPDYVILRQR